VDVAFTMACAPRSDSDLAVVERPRTRSPVRLRQGLSPEAGTCARDSARDHLGDSSLC